LKNELTTELENIELNEKVQEHADTIMKQRFELLKLKKKSKEDAETLSKYEKRILELYIENMFLKDRIDDLKLYQKNSTSKLDELLGKFKKIKLGGGK
jgi:FtsZ-binding cell division protein ZapB